MPENRQKLRGRAAGSVGKNDRGERLNAEQEQPRSSANDQWRRVPLRRVVVPPQTSSGNARLCEASRSSARVQRSTTNLPSLSERQLNAATPPSHARFGPTRQAPRAAFGDATDRQP